MEIISYGNKETAVFDLTGKVKKNCSWRDVRNIVKRKLDILIYADSISDIKVPPGNRFEWLKGDLAGFGSIRINNQWRLIFLINTKLQLESVAVVDYHKG